MNTPSSLSGPGSDFPGVPPIAGPRSKAVDWLQVWRLTVACNPFFLISAALLLLAVASLSTDPGFMVGERQKLFFNFGALQGYACLLVGTALVLASRRIWYDSALLVALEHALILAPFILLSGAALAGLGLAAALALSGATAAVIRVCAVRRWYGRYNLPPRALALGAVLLAANVALPLWFRAVVEATSVTEWPEPNRWIWLIALPAAAAAANLLPKPRARGVCAPEMAWTPLMIYGLWLAGSITHVLAVAYLGKGAAVTPDLTAPLALVLAWTLVNRSGDLMERPSPTALFVLYPFVIAVPLLAVENPLIAFVLAAVNVTAFLTVASRRAALRRWAIAGAWCSLLIVALFAPWEHLATMPHRVGELRQLHPFAAAAIAAAWCAGSRKWRVALLGGFCLFFAGQLAEPPVGGACLWRLALLYVLGHSVRWPASDPESRWFRRIIMALWVLTSGMSQLPWLESALLLAIWGLIWRVDHHRPPWTVPCLSMVAPLVNLADTAAPTVSAPAPGLFLLGFSLAFFAVGAAIAWRRRPQHG
jgi:hypothetical protein